MNSDSAPTISMHFLVRNVNTFSERGHLCPTEHFTISEPRNSSVELFELHEIRRLTDCLGLKLRNVWSDLSQQQSG